MPESDLDFSKIDGGAGMRNGIVIMIAAGLVGCGGACSGTADQPAPGPTTPDPQVVDHAGLAEIQFGDTRAELTRDHGLVEHPGECAPRLPDHPSASPVLDGDRLVLLWADPPLRTPTGLAVGSPVDEVHDTHPDAEELTAPPETFRFDGLLVTVDDRAYLFLHDQQQVQKLIVGYERHARLLFHENFGTC